MGRQSHRSREALLLWGMVIVSDLLAFQSRQVLGTNGSTETHRQNSLERSRVPLKSEGFTRILPNGTWNAWNVPTTLTFVGCGVRKQNGALERPLNSLPVLQKE